MIILVFEITLILILQWNKFLSVWPEMCCNPLSSCVTMEAFSGVNTVEDQAVDLPGMSVYACQSIPHVTEEREPRLETDVRWENLTRMQAYTGGWIRVSPSPQFQNQNSCSASWKVYSIPLHSKLLHVYCIWLFTIRMSKWLFPPCLPDSDPFTGCQNQISQSKEEAHPAELCVAPCLRPGLWPRWLTLPESRELRRIQSAGISDRAASSGKTVSASVASVTAFAPTLPTSTSQAIATSVSETTPPGWINNILNHV